MNVPDNAGGAQDNTNAAAPTNEAAPNLMAEAAAAQPPEAAPEPAAPAEQQAAPQHGQEKQGEAKPAMPKSLMQEAAEGEGNGESAAAASDAEAYDLKFPEGVVADPEAVKVLTSIGREFGVSDEKAQELATAATEYGDRRVQEQLKHFEKGFNDFCEANKAATRAVYGEKTTDVAREALRGLDAVLRTAPAVNGKQITSRDILSDPNVSAIANVPWFIHLCRTAGQYMTEQPGVSGGKGAERASEDFEW